MKVGALGDWGAILLSLGEEYLFRHALDTAGEWEETRQEEMKPPKMARRELECTIIADSFWKMLWRKKKILT